jgi:hypothetical protein
LARRLGMGDERKSVCPLLCTVWGDFFSQSA